MANPAVLSILFDKPAYAPGDLVTATVTYSDPNTGSTGMTGTYTVTGAATDAVTGETGTGTATFTVTPGGLFNLALAALSGGQGGQAWTKVSDDHVSKAVFTTTALAVLAPDTVVVTSPGAQAAVVGGVVSLQLAATSSAAGQVLSFTVTGLPAGLAASAAGLVTGTPTAAGTSAVTVTATDSTGAAGTASFSWTVNPAPVVVVPVPAALAGHALLNEYLPDALFTWRYLPGTTTPVTNGGFPMSSASSPRNVSVAGGVITLACTSASDCGVIQSPAKFPTASGVIEARVKFSGNGAHSFADWSSIWMYGDNWPTGGEIDAVETQYGNSYVSYHYAVSGANAEATTDPWTYAAKKVQLSPKNTTGSLPAAPNIVPDVWTVVDIAFGRDSGGAYYADVYYNGTLYCHVDGPYVTGAPMFLTAGAGFGAGTLGSSQAPYDVPGNIQLSYVRVFS